MSTFNVTSHLLPFIAILFIIIGVVAKFHLFDNYAILEIQLNEMMKNSR